MTTTLKSFSIAPKGVGRQDYSSSVAVAVESAVSMWQENFNFREVVAIPAADSVIVAYTIPAGYVAVIADWFASTPANVLIRMEPLLHRPPAPPVTVYDWTGYQQIQIHLAKPNFWEGGLRIRVHNYYSSAVNILVGCAGFTATSEAYTQQLGVR